MFEATITSVTGETRVVPEVEQMIAPQSSMRFWSVFLPEDEKGFRTTIFLNEARVESVELYGKDEEEEPSEGGKLVSLRPVPDPEGA